MNTNDAKLSRVFVQESGTAAAYPSNAPNAKIPPATSFDVVVEADCGDTLANTRAMYTLGTVLYNISQASNTWGMGVDENFITTPGWSHVDGPGSDWVYRKTISIPTSGPGSIAYNPGEMFRLTASLTEGGGNVVSFVESDIFILV